MSYNALNIDYNEGPRRKKQRELPVIRRTKFIKVTEKIKAEEEKIKGKYNKKEKESSEEEWGDVCMGSSDSDGMNNWTWSFYEEDSEGDCWWIA